MSKIILSGLILVLFTFKLGTTRSCRDKFAVFPHHSACLPPSDQYISNSGGISEADRKLIVDKHNELRAQTATNHRAADMQKMVWDEELVAVATGWAENCVFDHDELVNRRIPGRFTVGQNLGVGYTSWGQCIQAWYDEIKDFTYGDKNMDFMKVGHYTQLIWASSAKIGCAYAKCSDIGEFYVCNYGPSGNSGAGFTKPYSVGSACSKCRSTCSNGLCDCEGVVCSNGGILNPNTCDCKCSQEFHQGPKCELNCKDTEDLHYCGKDPYTKDACAKYGNVQFECPNMCQVCPWGGALYIEGSEPVPGRSHAAACQLSSIHLLLAILTVILRTTEI